MSAIYPKAKEQFMIGTVNLLSAPVTAALLKSTYTYDESHTSMASSISAHIATGTAPTIVLSGKTVSTSGVFDANDVLFQLMTAGQAVNAVIIYSADIPIAYVNAGVGFPFTTSGADVSVSFSNSADKIFKL